MGLLLPQDCSHHASPGEDHAHHEADHANEHEANFPILADPSKEMPDAYGVLMDRGFANRWTYYIGTDGTILKIDKETNPATAGRDLTNTMEALGFPKI